MNEELTARVGSLEENLRSVIRGKNEAIRLVLIAFLAGGHVLLEDVPGTGKTTLAKSLARSLDGAFRRVQFTPDLLPADITGSNYYRPQEGVFEFRQGPIFTNILLADEINRTSPRTQSALLEAMSEHQVTVDGKRRDLPSPFFVIATQNSSDYQGTYPLPEAQLDRFAARISLGYPDIETEIDILYSQHDGHPFELLDAVLSSKDVLEIQTSIRAVKIDRSIVEYMLKLVDTTRTDPRIRLGISPRGSLMLYRAVQSRARLEGRDYALPEDVRALAVPVLAHRLLLDAKARYGGLQTTHFIEEALERVPVPR